MKILLLTVDWAPSGGGGITRFSKGLVDGFIENGVTVDVMLEKDAPFSKIPNLDKSNINFIGVEFKKTPIKRALEFSKSLFFTKKLDSYDAVVSLTWSPTGTGVYLKNLIGKKIPYYIVCHGNDILEPQNSRYYKWLMKRVLSNAEGLLCNSNFTSQIAHNIGIKKDKLNVIGCGIVPEHIEEMKSNISLRQKYSLSNNPIILTVGRLVERKGHDFIIKSMPEILSKYPDCKYVITGEGPYKEELIRLAKSIDVLDSIIFTGFISDNEMYQYIRECDVFTMVSRNIMEKGEVEGFGIVFLEAGYFKKPVVAGDAGGMPDAVVDKKTGFVVDPVNKKEITKKIITLLDDVELREEMGNNGYKRVTELFTWKKIAKNVEEIISRNHL